jgi:glycosyltransferase involved in cell wall biosynthesis
MFVRMPPNFLTLLPISSLAYILVELQSQQAFEMPQGKARIAVVCSLTTSLVNFRFHLLKAMTDNGHEVYALGPEYDRPTIDRLQSIGVNFVQIPMARAGLNPLEDLRTLAAIWRELRRLSPDVVLAYTMKPIIYGLLAARMAGVRERHALCTGLGYVFSEVAQDRKRLLVRRVATELYKHALAGGGRVFVYNDADERDIINTRMISDPFRIVRVDGSGVDLEAFSAAPLPPGPPVFILIARLLREKGLIEFAEAARILTKRGVEARFQVLGPPDPGPLGISVVEINSWPAIEYLGETSDVRSYLGNASVFVLPSYYREGIPRSILEAMAMGRAIVTADTPGCAATVVHGENGFIVPPRDAVALADALEKFIAEPSLTRKMGARSRELARERFDTHRINRDLLQAMRLLRRDQASGHMRNAPAHASAEK